MARGPSSARKDGRICKAKVFSKCPSYREPMESGVPAIVIRKEVLAEFPMLPTFLQEAANATHEAIGRQTKIATLLQIYRLAKQNLALHNDERWTTIANNIERSKSYLKGQCTDMCAFVKNYGGVSGEYVQDLSDYAQTVGEKHRDISGVTFGVMAKLSFQQGPRFVTALAKAPSPPPEGGGENGGGLGKDEAEE